MPQHSESPHASITLLKNISKYSLQLVNKIHNSKTVCTIHVRELWSIIDDFQFAWKWLTQRSFSSPPQQHINYTVSCMQQCWLALRHVFLVWWQIYTRDVPAPQNNPLCLNLWLNYISSMYTFSRFLSPFYQWSSHATLDLTISLLIQPFHYWQNHFKFFNPIWNRIDLYIRS